MALYYFYRIFYFYIYLQNTYKRRQSIVKFNMFYFKYNEYNQNKKIIASNYLKKSVASKNHQKYIKLTKLIIIRNIY